MLFCSGKGLQGTIAHRAPFYGGSLEIIWTVPLTCSLNQKFRTMKFDYTMKKLNTYLKL